MLATVVVLGVGVAVVRKKRGHARTKKQHNRIMEREARDEEYCDRIGRPFITWMRPVRLLSFDGGGVRGLLSLVMLKELMDQVGHGALPCQYFDLIGGTSTGGLIAIMLGRLRMSVDQCIKAYLELAESIFDANKVDRAVDLVLHAAQFDGRRLQAAIEQIVEKHGNGNRMYEQTDGDICRTFVVAIRGLQANLAPKLFRSYHNFRDASLADDCQIWEAGRATSCAPGFFPEIKVEGIVYADGGLGHNNPSRLVLDEARSLWGQDVPIRCLVSFGTGQIHENIVRSRSVLGLVRLVPVLKEIALNCEQTHLSVEKEFYRSGAYHRFNVMLKEGIDLNEWERMQEMQVIAVRYMQRERQKFTDCANVIGGV